MKPLTQAQHDTLILYVIYTALTRWIPLPLADQVVANILRREMVERLAQAHGVTMARPAVKILADEQIGCLYGCLFNVLLFPIKILVGKLFLLFRMTRFLNEASRGYHAARLTEYALRAGLLAPQGMHTPEAVRAAIDAVCGQANLGPVGAAFRQVLKKHAGVLRDIAGLFHRAFRSLRGRGEGAAEEAVQTAEDQARGKTASLIAPLRTALEDIPPEHFLNLEARLEELLRNPPQAQ